MPDLRNRLLTRVIAPEEEPFTLPEAKLYLRVTHGDEDLLINDLIVAARMTAEQWLKRSLITQTWKLAYDNCIPESVTLPMGPINGITSVVIVNRDTTTQTVDPAIYYLNAAQDAVIFQSALLGFRIEITYTAGYGNADAVPGPIKQGLFAHIAAMYDHRGDAGAHGFPDQTLSLYMPYRGMSL